MDLVDRVASRHIARNEAEDAAWDLFEKGTPPDDRPWHGRSPELRVSFAGVQATNVKIREGRDGIHHVAALLVADPKHWADGVYSDSGLFQRFLKAYPGQEKVLLKTFLMFLDESKITRDIKKHYENKDFAWHLMTAIFGRDAEEWEMPTRVNVQKVIFKRPPIWDRGAIKVPWNALVTFDTEKKAPVHRAPFSEMSDRDLDDWIARWEERAPENFWMDGELNLSRRDAYRMYRRQWRRMSPRKQVELMNDLK